MATLKINLVEKTDSGKNANTSAQRNETRPSEANQKVETITKDRSHTTEVMDTDKGI